MFSSAFVLFLLFGLQEKANFWAIHKMTKLKFKKDGGWWKARPIRLFPLLGGWDGSRVRPTSALRSRYCLIRDLRVKIAPDSDIKKSFFSEKSKTAKEGGRPVEDRKKLDEKRAEASK